MQIKYCFVSPGRVSKEELKDHNKTFSVISDSISINPKAKYEVIGHGAASWRYYPMGVNKKGLVYGNGYKNKKTQALNIVQLIDSSIAMDPEMSIELDAQYPPANHELKKRFPEDGAYILHDVPKWKKGYMSLNSSLNYFHQNTLLIALNHHTAKGYHQKSKVYVEIKACKNCIDITSQELDCKDQCIALANEVKDLVIQFKRDDQQNWLCITSFSPAALDAFRNALPDSLKGAVDFILIAGHTRKFITACIAQSKGHVPRYDAEMKCFIVHTEWLNCIWFSGQGIPKFNELFTEISQKRKTLHPDWNPVEFSFSTYQKKSEKMKNMMMKSPGLQVEIRSFMLDLDYRIENEIP